MKEFDIKGIDSTVALAKILLENGHKVVISPQELLGAEEYVFFKDYVYNVMYIEVDDLE